MIMNMNEHHWHVLNALERAQSTYSKEVRYSSHPSGRKRALTLRSTVTFSYVLRSSSTQSQSDLDVVSFLDLGSRLRVSVGAVSLKTSPLP